MAAVLRVNTVYAANSSGNVTFLNDVTLNTGAVYTANAALSNAYGTRTVSSSSPSGGIDGDIHYQYT